MTPEAEAVHREPERDDLPERVVVDKNGAYWRDYRDHYSMPPVSEDNDPIEPVTVYVRAERLDNCEEALTDAERRAGDIEREAAHRDTGIDLRRCNAMGLCDLDYGHEGMHETTPDRVLGAEAAHREERVAAWNREMDDGHYEEINERMGTEAEAAHRDALVKRIAATLPYKVMGCELTDGVRDAIASNMLAFDPALFREEAEAAHRDSPSLRDAVRAVLDAVEPRPTSAPGQSITPHIGYNHAAMIALSTAFAAPPIASRDDEVAAIAWFWHRAFHAWKDVESCSTDPDMAARLYDAGLRLAAPSAPSSGDLDAAWRERLAEIVSDSLAATTEGTDWAEAPEPSDEPGSPYVLRLTNEIAARLASQQESGK